MRLTPLCLFLILSPMAVAQDSVTEPTAGSAQAGQPDAAAPGEGPVRLFEWAEENLATSYGMEGVRSLRFTGSLADDLNDTTTGAGTFGVSWFLYDELEAGFEIGAWHFNQPGDNANAISLSGVGRWHFLIDDERDWSVFADVGFGMIASDHSVPSDGSSVNFLPRVGIGGTYRITHDGARLEGGIAWQHLSNARLFGDEDNAGLDSARIFIGLVFPF